MAGVVRDVACIEDRGASQCHREQRISEADPVDVHDAAETALVHEHILRRHVVEKRSRGNLRKVR